MALKREPKALLWGALIVVTFAAMSSRVIIYQPDVKQGTWSIQENSSFKSSGLSFTTTARFEDQVRSSAVEWELAYAGNAVDVELA